VTAILVRVKIGSPVLFTQERTSMDEKSYNGNKIIGSSSGMILTDSLEDDNRVRMWSSQSREDAQWYQHE